MKMEGRRDYEGGGRGGGGGGGEEGKEEGDGFMADRINLMAATGISLRDYQSNALELAMECNLVICAPPGSGKSLIAIHFVERMLSMSKEKMKGLTKGKSGRKPRKVAFILAPTKAITEQFGNEVKKHTRLRVSCLYGKESSTASIGVWRGVLESVEVLCMSPDIFLKVLNSGAEYLTMDEVCAIVFDECHHTAKRHAYNIIMQTHYTHLPESTRPRLLGLTASPNLACVENMCAREYVVDLESTLPFIPNTKLTSVFAPSIMQELFPFRKEISPHVRRCIDSILQVERNIFTMKRSGDCEKSKKRVMQSIFMQILETSVCYKGCGWTMSEAIMRQHNSLGYISTSSFKQIEAKTSSGNTEEKSNHKHILNEEEDEKEAAEIESAKASLALWTATFQIMNEFFSTYWDEIEVLGRLLARRCSILHQRTAKLLLVMARRRTMDVLHAVADLGLLAGLYLMSRLTYPFRSTSTTSSDLSAYHTMCNGIQIRLRDVFVKNARHVSEETQNIMMEASDTCRNPRDWVTDKVLVAAKVLYERKKYGPALLFVNRRLFAFVLYHILYIEQQQGFIRGGEDTSYLRLGVAVGNAMCFNSDHQLFPGHLVYNKDQRDEFIFPGKQWMDVVNFTHGLSDFRDEEIDVLIATPVLAEGIDVPTCATTILFDFPADAVRVLQMGGRARNADMDPQCIALLCTCAEKKMWDDMSIVINRLRMSEMRSTNDRTGKVLLSEIAIAQGKVGRYEVKETGAKMSVDNSVSLLHSFCQSAHFSSPSEAMELAAKEDEIEGALSALKGRSEHYNSGDILNDAAVENDEIHTKISDDMDWRPLYCMWKDPAKGGKVSCKLVLPRRFKLPSFFVDASNSVEAKALVSLEACIYLHRNGFLDNNLQSRVSRRAIVNFISVGMSAYTDDTIDDDIGNSHANEHYLTLIPEGWTSRIGDTDTNGKSEPMRSDAQPNDVMNLPSDYMNKGLSENELPNFGGSKLDEAAPKEVASDIFPSDVGASISAGMERDRLYVSVLTVPCVPFANESDNQSQPRLAIFSVYPVATGVQYDIIRGHMALDDFPDSFPSVSELGVITLSPEDIKLVVNYHRVCYDVLLNCGEKSIKWNRHASVQEMTSDAVWSNAYVDNCFEANIHLNDKGYALGLIRPPFLEKSGELHLDRHRMTIAVQIYLSSREIHCHRVLQDISKKAKMQDQRIVVRSHNNQYNVPIPLTTKQPEFVIGTLVPTTGGSGKREGATLPEPRQGSEKEISEVFIPSTPCVPECEDIDRDSRIVFSATKALMRPRLFMKTRLLSSLKNPDLVIDNAFVSQFLSYCRRQPDEWYPRELVAVPKWWWISDELRIDKSIRSHGIECLPEEKFLDDVIEVKALNNMLQDILRIFDAARVIPSEEKEGSGNDESELKKEILPNDDDRKEDDEEDEEEEEKEEGEEENGMRVGIVREASVEADVPPTNGSASSQSNKQIPVVRKPTAGNFWGVRLGKRRRYVFPKRYPRVISAAKGLHSDGNDLIVKEDSKCTVFDGIVPDVGELGLPSPLTFTVFAEFTYLTIYSFYLDRLRQQYILKDKIFPPISMPCCPCPYRMPLRIVGLCMSSIAYERLEFLGDTCLKMYVGVMMYDNVPEMFAEFGLSLIRANLVSNKTLFTLFDKKNLYGFVAKRLQKNVLQMWTPSLVTDDISVLIVRAKRADKRPLKDYADMVEALIGAYFHYGIYLAQQHRSNSVNTLHSSSSSSSSSSMTSEDYCNGDSYNNAHLSWGTTADVLYLEDLVGPFFDYLGMRTRLFRVVKHLAVTLVHNGDVDANSLADQVDLCDTKLTREEEIVRHKLLMQRMSAGLVKRFAPYFSFLQDKLEYEFKEIGLLQRAMCSKNSLWYGVENFSQGESNERMEFLGDAVLDTVIVWWLYLSFPDASPAVLTFFKGLLVNNYVLCSVAVHELQVQDSPAIGSKTKKFIDTRLFPPPVQCLRELLNDADIISSPPTFKAPALPPSVKALADITEAVLGALYIDNEHNLVPLQRIVMKNILKKSMGELIRWSQTIPNPEFRYVHYEL